MTHYPWLGGRTISFAAWSMCFTTPSRRPIAVFDGNKSWGKGKKQKTKKRWTKQKKDDARFDR
jgi:hypothetical protein